MKTPFTLPDFQSTCWQAHRPCEASSFLRSLALYLAWRINAHHESSAYEKM